MQELKIGRLRGKLCVTWDDPATGKRRRFQLKARTDEEANAEAIRIWQRENLGGAGDTVTALWSAYIVDLGAKPTAATMGYTGKAVLGFFGGLRPDQITVEHCREYAKLRRNQGRSENTIHTELGHLRSTLVWGQKRRLIDHAPYIEKVPKPQADVRPLTPDELSHLLRACDDVFHLRLAVILAATTGARQGAILDLTWERVSFENGSINLRKPDGARRKGRAIVPMNRTNRAALREAQALARTDFVIEWNGKPVQSIRTTWDKARRAAGLEWLKFHDLRHTAAVNMLVAGIPLEKVAQFLGHSNTRVTYDTYGRFLPDHMSDAAATLEIPIHGVSDVFGT